MSRINILDCTLRDGGYVNDWNFGQDNINFICKSLENTGVDILELGFMRNETYRTNRAIYYSIDQLKPIIGEKKKNVIYSALIEMANYFPPELIEKRKECGPDLLRYSFWMRSLDEAYEYCSRIVEKGYLLGVQPTRVEQYSDEQFSEMCERFSKLNPYAIYIVDTFGLLSKEQLIRYSRIADEYVAEGIRVGYHAHNNMQQAFSNATTFIELGLKHEQVVDASVYGMGRGAGNLNLEMICNYLEQSNIRHFKLSPIYEIWDECLKSVYSTSPWGYSLEYFIAAINQCNPNYPYYYLKEHSDLKTNDYKRIIESISGKDKYLYSRDNAEKYYMNVVK